MTHRARFVAVSTLSAFCLSCHTQMDKSYSRETGNAETPVAQASLLQSTLEQIRTVYLHAVSQDAWPADLRPILHDRDRQDELQRELTKFEKGEVNRCAIAYVLALAREDSTEYVKVMLESEQRWRDGFAAKSFEDDALQALPEALDVVWRKKRSKPALHALVTLSLDGGPAETLGLVRLRLLREYGDDLLRAIYQVTSGDFEKSTQRGSFSCLQDLRFRLSDRSIYPDDYQVEMQALSQLRKSATKHDSEYHRFVMKCVAYVLRPWQEDSPR